MLNGIANGFSAFWQGLRDVLKAIGRLFVWKPSVKSPTENIKLPEQPVTTSPPPTQTITPTSSVTHPMPVLPSHKLEPISKEEGIKHLMAEAEKLYEYDPRSPFKDFLTEQEKARLKDQVEKIRGLKADSPDLDGLVSNLKKDLDQIQAMREPLEHALKTYAKELQQSNEKLFKSAMKVKGDDTFKNTRSAFIRAAENLTAGLGLGKKSLFQVVFDEGSTLQHYFHIKVFLNEALQSSHKLQLAMPGFTETIPDNIEESRREARQKVIDISDNVKLLNYGTDANTIKLRIHLSLLEKFSESPITLPKDAGLYLAIKEQMKIVEDLEQQLSQKASAAPAV